MQASLDNEKSFGKWSKAMHVYQIFFYPYCAFNLF